MNANIHGSISRKLLNNIKKLHIDIEQKLQQLNFDISNSYCSRCDSVCCEEVFCRESITSSFLRFILGPAVEDYDKKNGWYNKKSGCKLKFGRPIICYDFYCSKIPDNKIKKVKQIIRDLNKAYSKVNKGMHILVIDDLRCIKVEKLEKIQKNLLEILVSAK